MTIDVDQQVLEAKNANEIALLKYPNVQSVGIGHKNDTTEECVVVGVTKKVPEDQLDVSEIIPSEVNGVKTDVQEVGEIVPELLVPQLDRMGRHRPIPLGVSVGHPNITAGSTGWLYETDDGTIYLGSNNHVLADVNNASIGDDQYQPGTADGGDAGDTFGTLAYYTLVADGVDVDLALAEVGGGIGIDNQLVDVDGEIIGVVDSLAVGDELVKSGRTTGVTRNTIQQLDASVNVNYGGDIGTVTITGCILTGDMSDGGDSGSPTAKETADGLLAAGRLFAGSDSVTVHHHIDNELNRLQNEFAPTIQLMTNGGDGGGDQPTANVTLTLTETQQQMGNIQATVNDQDGNPLQDANVDISGPASDSQLTDQNGQALFEGIPIGNYSIVATKDGFEEDSVDIASDDFQ